MCIRDRDKREHHPCNLKFVHHPQQVKLMLTSVNAGIIMFHRLEKLSHVGNMINSAKKIYCLYFIYKKSKFQLSPPTKKKRKRKKKWVVNGCIL